MQNIKRAFKELLRYPSAIVGIVLILVLVGVAVYTLFALPYNETIALWRASEESWKYNPRNAAPAWLNIFNSKKQPLSFLMNTETNPEALFVEERDDGTKNIIYTYTFDYEADDFPQDLVFFFTATYSDRNPFATIMLTTPDGREIRVADVGVDTATTYRVSQDQRLIKKYNTTSPQEVLLADPNITGEDLVPLKGTYTMVIDILTSETDSEISVELCLHGTLAGPFGTDHLRRDLTIALLWGTPVALSFGLLASVGTSILTMGFAAAGAWYGGWIDELINRITEINLVLPFLNILIMIGTFYSKSVWTILGATIILSIFTAAIKTYRAIFLQVKESGYVEAAKAYGAGNLRIIIQYMIPRIIPLLLPTLVIGVPAFVFLEASLAVLGLGDPVLPTWGKIIQNANQNAALYNGWYYWILEPAVLLMLTGLAFSMLGYSLDRVFNPRLRGQ